MDGSRDVACTSSTAEPSRALPHPTTRQSVLIRTVLRYGWQPPDQFLSDHRKAARQPIKPPMLHAASTTNVRQCSQLPAGSKMTISGGNRTDRNP